MDITLYRNCILNRNYREVFDTLSEERVNDVSASPFIHYLNSLSSYSFASQNRFLNDSGTLNIPLFEFNIHAVPVIPLRTAYDYNYMKISNMVDGMSFSNGQSQNYTTGVNIVKFYFIESIEILNDIVSIKYNIDVWHTYRSAMWNILNRIPGEELFKSRYSALKSSKIVKYNTGGMNEFNVKFYKPPMEYTGNNKLDIVETETENKEYYLVVNYSLYDAEQQGVLSKRKTHTAIIIYKELDENQTPTGDFVSTFLGWDPTHASQNKLTYKMVLNDLILKSSDANKPMVDTTTGTGSFYEILSVYLIPKKMINVALYSRNNVNVLPFESAKDTAINTPFSYWSYINYGGFRLYFVDADKSLLTKDVTSGNEKYYNYGDLIKFYTKSITNDFKNVGVGFYTQMLPVVANGNDVDIDIFYCCNSFDFKLFISVQNTIYEITDAFKLEIPMTVTDGNTTALNKITKALKDTVLKNQQSMEIASFINKFVSSAGDIIGGATLASASGGALGLGNIASGSISVVTSPVEFVYKLDTIKSELEANSAKVFTTNKGLSVENSSEVNAKHGLVIFKINPDNETEVADSINFFGYECSEIVNAKQILNLDPATILREKFNVVKFSAITVYGAFPQNIAETFEKILTNGVKIWYTYAIQ